MMPPESPGVHLALFAHGKSTHCSDRNEGYIFRKFQRGLSSIESWCERCNIKINADKTRATYFFSRLRPVEAYLILKGRNSPFVNHVKYLGVIFDRKITLRLHIEMVEAKTFRTFIRFYSLIKIERLNANIKLSLHKALIRSIMTYACPA
jgi:hypothetical protein